VIRERAFIIQWISRLAPTSGRFARIVDNNVVFDLTQISVPSRDQLDHQATLLRIDEAPRGS
jgi:hypothetical protein